MTTFKAMKDLCDERIAQDKQWGGPAHDDMHDTYDWMNYIANQAEKLARDESTARERFIKIAALAVAAVESIDRKTP